MYRSQRQSVYEGLQRSCRRQPSEILERRTGACERVEFGTRRRNPCAAVVRGGTHQRKNAYALPAWVSVSMMVFRNWLFSSSETFHSLSHRSTSDFVRARTSNSPLAAATWTRVVDIGSLNAEVRGAALNKLDNLG